MNITYLKEERLPFCNGCGHTNISESTNKALQKSGLNLLDVILVTDIGCHGIVDKNFKTHTVHGLHGRSVALASGISAGINNPDKKVIVFIGDGGVTIGMQHIIDAAHRNFNLTVVVHNNMLYGMTGGQSSEFTPLGFKTPTVPDGVKTQGFDICGLVSAAGASYVARVLGIGDISDQLAVAFSKKGFSLLEVMEICPSYGVKSNPGMKLSKVVEEAGLDVKVYADHPHDGFKTNIRRGFPSLIEKQVPVPVKYQSSIKKSVSIMISGSAGEGVQLAAELFAKSAIASGLNVTKKGSYPVTVGIGFSSSDIIISPEEILYTASPKPDVMIITSEDGLAYSRGALNNMDMGLLIIDEELDVPNTSVEVHRFPFRKMAGNKTAALFSLLYYLKKKETFPVEALFDILENSKFISKIDLRKLTADV
jgi:pyruvate/2-oxoacid:ferredoxin oxidoreductase beta subunit